MSSSPHTMERPQQRPRTKSRTFSLLSIKSGSSGSSKIKVDDLRESEAAKKRSRFSGVSKVNPLRAMNEAEPAAVQAHEQTTIAPLRAMQHKDTRGNLITDPDSSNPTRSRIERPLDTIRSFDAAVDASYKRRTQIMRAESDNAATTTTSRRSSYFGGYETPNSPATPSPLNPRYAPTGGYNGGRHPTYNASRDPYAPAPSSWQQRRGPPHRMQSAPMVQRQMDPQGHPPQFYGQQQHPHHYHQQQQHHLQQQQQQQQQRRNSYGWYGQPEQQEGTTTSGSLGSQSEPWTNSTDPSSENSSMERMQAVRPRDGIETHLPNAPRKAPPQQAPVEDYWPDDPNSPGTQMVDYASTLQSRQARYDPSKYNPMPQQTSTHGIQHNPQEQRQQYASYQSPFKGNGDHDRATYGQATPHAGHYLPGSARPPPNQVAYPQQQTSQQQWETRRLQRQQTNRQPPVASRPEKPEKRKSWLRRTFSKN